MLKSNKQGWEGSKHGMYTDLDSKFYTEFVFLFFFSFKSLFWPTTKKLGALKISNMVWEQG